MFFLHWQRSAPFFVRAQKVEFGWLGGKSDMELGYEDVAILSNPLLLDISFTSAK